jgi:predicted site-specific integrase-resolvase
MGLDRDGASLNRTSASEPLTETEAARRLGLKVATLRAWRHRGVGPPFVRLGRAIRYLSGDLERYIGEHRHAPAATAQD